MNKNIEKLAEIGENKLKYDLVMKLNDLDQILYNLSSDENKYAKDSNIRILEIDNHSYLEQAKFIKNQCGLDFSNLNENYNKKLPEINKYLGEMK